MTISHKIIIEKDNLGVCTSVNLPELKKVHSFIPTSKATEENQESQTANLKSGLSSYFFKSSMSTHTKKQIALQKSSQAQTSTMTVIQNQQHIQERVSGILGLLNNKAAKTSEIWGPKERVNRKQVRGGRGSMGPEISCQRKHKSIPVMGAVCLKENPSQKRI